MPAKTVIQTRRDTAANWASTNPTLAAGEIGFETDTGFAKIGDGTTLYNSLSRIYLPSTTISAAQNQGSATLDVYDRLLVTANNNAQSNQRQQLTFFTPIKETTISNITYTSGGTAAASLTLCRFGLYTIASNDDATLVARTASDTTIFAATNTAYTRALDTTGGYPASYTLKPNQRYAVACLQVGTTMATVVGTIYSTLTSNLSPRISAYRANQTDLPTTIANADYITVGFSLFARLS